jgi:ferredoxin-NADP reductase
MLVDIGAMIDRHFAVEAKITAAYLARCEEVMALQKKLDAALNEAKHQSKWHEYYKKEFYRLKGEFGNEICFVTKSPN